MSRRKRVPRIIPCGSFPGWLTDAVLARLSPRFDQMYATMGRPSIPPEQLLRALLLQPLYSIGNERLLMEQLDYDLLFRWFVGLGTESLTPTSAALRVPGLRGESASTRPVR